MRSISSNIAAQIAASVATPRTLYVATIKHKVTGATQVLRLTNHHADITFQSQVYSSYQVKHSNIKTYLTNQVDNVTVNIDNIDRGMSSYFAYYDFSGQPAEIYKVFLDANGAVIDTGPTDKIIEFVGSMDTPKVSEENIEIRIVNAFDHSQSYSPWRRFTSKCNWDFCGAECLYNSGNGKPRGTATSGSTTTLADTALGSFATNYWKGASLKILSGANKGEIRRVSAYNGTTKTFTVEGSFPVAIDTTSKYIVECDKSKSTCKGFAATGSWSGNEGKFDGFDEVQRIGYDPTKNPLSGKFVLSSTLSDAVPSSPSLKYVEHAGEFIPLIYGTGVVEGRLLAYGDSGNKYYHSQTRIYGFLAGEIDSVVECVGNGKKVDRSLTTAYQE